MELRDRGELCASPYHSHRMAAHMSTASLRRADCPATNIRGHDGDSSGRRAGQDGHELDRDRAAPAAWHPAGRAATDERAACPAQGLSDLVPALLQHADLLPGSLVHTHALE